MDRAAEPEEEPVRRAFRLHREADERSLSIRQYRETLCSRAAGGEAALLRRLPCRVTTMVISSLSLSVSIHIFLFACSSFLHLALSLLTDLKLGYYYHSRISIGRRRNARPPPTLPEVLPDLCSSSSSSSSSLPPLIAALY